MIKSTIYSMQIKPIITASLLFVVFVAAQKLNTNQEDTSLRDLLADPEDYLFIKPVKTVILDEHDDEV